MNSHKYTVWYSAEDMYALGKSWLSEIRFHIDEHAFLEKLLAQHFVKLSTQDYFHKTQQWITELSRNQERAKKLHTTIRKHQNKIEVLIDNENQFEEEAKVKATFNQLIQKYNEYHQQFRNLKQNIFDLISSLMKQEHTILLN
ncbi:hypothetical protein ABN763_15505 [Spongiivirga sp. MCCC 1A20706]|uniref:hypothetical protein n=1 Tax=Spongiivirga sp. MCCC 1A20706 TaxID=3160963 RepID=UPI003977D3B7